MSFFLPTSTNTQFDGGHKQNPMRCASFQHEVMCDVGSNNISLQWKTSIWSPYLGLGAQLRLVVVYPHYLPRVEQTWISGGCLGLMHHQQYQHLQHHRLESWEHDIILHDIVVWFGMLSRFFFGGGAFSLGQFSRANKRWESFREGIKIQLEP